MTTIVTSADHRLTMKTDREVIEDALALIEVEGGWTQGTYCRDAEGCEVHPTPAVPDGWVRKRAEHVGGGGYVVRTEPGARPCSFCLGGALRVAAGYWQSAMPHAAQAQIDRLERLLLQIANAVDVPGWLSLQAYNDDAHTTKTDAVLTLKRAATSVDRSSYVQHPRRTEIPPFAPA
ncbi:Uncharacterised protein [Mycolicibacterium flavescens]|nr:Uncharacterised protein [Mycolicibacterium flavescens]